MIIKKLKITKGGFLLEEEEEEEEEEDWEQDQRGSGGFAGEVFLFFVERSGGRRRSRRSQRRQDFLALWCAPTPEVRFNTRGGGGEAGRSVHCSQRERERLESTPPSRTVGSEHPCASRTQPETRR